MKPCIYCGQTKADEEYSIDKTREDGLALTCRECNKERCRRYYAENRDRQIARAQEYKAIHGHTPNLPKSEKVQRQRRKEEVQKADEPGDFQLIRFSQSEWLFCLQEAQELGLTGSDYVRILVRDARRCKKKEGEG